MTRLKIDIPRTKIRNFCIKWKITEFALFGSVLRDDFDSDSDIDVLVTFASNAHHSLFDLFTMQEELQKIFKRDVDLVEKAGLRNPFRKKAILENNEVVYES